MTSMEKKNQTERLERLRQELLARFSTRVIKGEQCFEGPGDTFFLATLLPSWNAIVIEYAHGIREAVLNQYEDGDVFYLDEMDDEALLRAVLKEILR